jgi:hypothetical protein
MVDYSKDLNWYWQCKWCRNTVGISGYKSKKDAEVGLQMHLSRRHNAN